MLTFPTHAPGEGGRDVCEFQIKARVQHRLLCRRERRRCGVFIRLALIDRFCGAKRRFFQPLGAREFDLLELEPSPRRLNGSDRLLEFDLKRARIDHEERIAFLNDLPIRKEISDSMPPTCARSSTRSTAENSPMNVTFGASCRTSGAPTETLGGAAA